MTAPHPLERPMLAAVVNDRSSSSRAADAPLAVWYLESGLRMDIPLLCCMCFKALLFYYDFVFEVD